MTDKTNNKTNRTNKEESFYQKTLLEADVAPAKEGDGPILEESLLAAREKSSPRANSGLRSFLKRQNIEISFQRYAVDALGAMALGLFASLLIGTIVNSLAGLVGHESNLGTWLALAGSYASKATGPAMAVAIGYSLKAPALVLFTLTGVGLAANDLAGAGGPLAVLVVALLACECGKLVSKTSKVDILVTPLVTLLVGLGLATSLAPGIGQLATSVGNAIVWATNQQPLLMGILVSVLMGIALTLPISSAAIAAAFGLVGLAGGAAHAGCCAQMVGFAVMSYPENGLGGLVAQGLGTSMLQMPNIVKNPKIWLPPILASAITGPLSTLVFKLEMNGPPISSGMGTSGLVGPIGLVTGWFNPSEAALSYGLKSLQAGGMDYLNLFLISFVLPALLTWIFAKIFRQLGWIKAKDLKLNLG